MRIRNMKPVVTVIRWCPLTNTNGGGSALGFAGYECSSSFMLRQPERHRYARGAASLMNKALSDFSYYYNSLHIIPVDTYHVSALGNR
jgi:hypothetical protein